MIDPNEPTNVRQGRQGKPVLVILAISLALAVVVGWLLWGNAADQPEAAFLQPGAVFAADTHMPAAPALA